MNDLKTRIIDADLTQIILCMVKHWYSSEKFEIEGNSHLTE